MQVNIKNGKKYKYINNRINKNIYRTKISDWCEIVKSSQIFRLITGYITSSLIDLEFCFARC